MREIKRDRVVLPRVDSGSTIVFDVETNGLDWKRNQTVGFAIGLGPRPEDAFYLPIRHAIGNLPIEPVLAWIGDIARDPNNRIVGQNLKFDMHFAQNDSITFAGPVECTMVNAALINENLYSYSLETLCASYQVAYPKAGDALYRAFARIFGGEPTRKAQMGNFAKADPRLPELGAYVKSDVLATWAIWEQQQKMLDEQDLRRVWEVECRVLRTLQVMERRGVAVDEERAHFVRKELETRLRKMEKKIPKGLNVRSPKQLKAWFSTFGISGWPQTDKGNDSFPESWLKTHEPGQTIVGIRKSSNIINSFIDPLIKEHIYNGRVHTNFNQLRQDDYGTVTGRLSSSDPNMQQCPKRDKPLAILFRSIFISDKGYRWSANDYSQQEFRVFADYSRAPLLVEGYKANPPVDIHTQVAKLLGVERDPTAKRMNLGMLYGMGVRKLAESLGVKEAVAKAWRLEYDAVLPEARKFLKEAEYWARRRGYVRTKLGRRRRFPEVHFAHKAGNSVIQGSSADITKYKMTEIDGLFAQEGRAAQLLLQVHDELDWQVPIGKEGTRIDKQARAIMEEFRTGLITLEVPLTVDARMGRNWAEATFGTID